MVDLEVRWAIGDRTPLPGASEGLLSGCAVCGQKEGIRICSACRVVAYCGEEHQRAHRATHRFVCNGIKTEQDTLEAAEANLIGSGHVVNTLPMLPGMNPNVQQLFDTYWHSPLFIYLRRINTVRSVEAQKQYFLRCDSLLFARSLEFRFAALEATAGLEQDQELYYSIKSLCVSPMFHRCFEHEDVLEPIDFMIYTPNSFWYDRILDLLILMKFFKVKLLLDMMRLDVARKALAPMLPLEIVDMILSNVPQSPTITANRKIINSTDLKLEITTLAKQIDILIAEVRARNSLFWKKLATHNPKDVLRERLTQ
ncbi:hypothetical protein N7540_005553 [Penicillium herquei]|nr:hypothetical protein N7540_005553 [Penicillium herquei]